jgi:ATP-dependent Zn protease
LVQFFYTPLNIPEFKSLFLGESELSPEEKKIMKGRENEVSEKFKQKTDEEVRNLLKNYVEKMKEYLHLDKGNWEKLSKKPWPLNYEDLWNIDFTQKTKYDGKKKI